MTRAHSPDFTLSEAGGTQLQALHTLSALGWRYIPRAEAERQRHGRRSSVLLEDVLAESLSRLNAIRRSGKAHPFSDSNIGEAIARLKEVRFDGLLRTNEKVTDLLQLGTALPQRVEGEMREWQLRYIDWDDWRANSFHMTAEFPVEWPDGGAIRPDIVLFVNGIPFAVIEVKRSQEETAQGISQHLRNQKADVGAPNLFFSAQLLIAANAHGPRYATVGTPAKFWSAWKERDDDPAYAGQVVNRELDAIESQGIFADFSLHQAKHTGLMRSGGRIATSLDEMLVSLARPERLIELARRYVLFDGPFKKIARHQQFFAVRDLLRRVERRDAHGRREGGVVWHTQGSGKSLTMVMLAKAVAMTIRDARLVLVTDRTDLDKQIADTFRATGMEPDRARSGDHLVELVEKRTAVITTVIHKFRAALSKRQFSDLGSDIFVLVDESHRSQYGDLESLHARMREVFPNACLIGFTGTPIAKKERNTFLKFGRLIEPAYRMRDAVEDGAVVPLLYEGRHVEEDLDEGAIDAWFDRVTRGLSDAQKADLKKKMSRPRVVMGVSARLRCIAFDVTRHFADNFKGTGLKGQVVAPSKRDASVLKTLLDEFGEVTSEVIISAPDDREGERAVDEENDDEVVRFWRKMMERWRGEENYNRGIVDAFKAGGDPDLLIVVDKLLTGFDAPRNTVLYLARPLREHSLLQAIARVNRVFDDDDAPPKPFGYIIDYSGVLQDLGEALTANDALRGFDEADISRAITSIADEARTLTERHAALLDLFAGVSNRFDEEAYARALADEALRDEFYRALSAFSRTLTVAVASQTFLDETPPERLARWRADEKRFIALRAHVKARYAESVEWSDYERRVRDVLDQHITAHEVITIVEPLSLFDDAAIEAARAEGHRSDASIADEIAHRTLRSIEEKWQQDPVFFDRFSKLIREAIEAFRKRRLDEQVYLEQVRTLRDRIETRDDDADPTPAAIKGKGNETAFWGIAQRELKAAGIADGDLALHVAQSATEIIESHRSVGWQHDRDVQNRIRNAIDDFFFDDARLAAGGTLRPEVIDAITESVLAAARVRMADDGRLR
ncbi:type I restriction endonuclease subunit R [Caulobacter sp. NIBR2454]|uniref:type I restriction endonuclease subunit R n=1 Tax=Caulobacter sp. NIBR2454 TaxID=3015996 RepID=UPI0022B5E6AC|nr:HsdR family type I site-specific deoxyribonuclease [Caulobacter sp. NIBR2454]